MRRGIIVIPIIVFMSGCAAYTDGSPPKHESITYTLKADGTCDYTKPVLATNAKGLTYQLRPDGYRDYTNPATITVKR